MLTGSSTGCMHEHQVETPCCLHEAVLCINSWHFLPVHVVKVHLTCLCYATGAGFPPVFIGAAIQRPSHTRVVLLLQDRIGIDVQLLDEMQKSILGLYRTPPSLSPSAAGQRDLDAIQESINGLCSASIQTALYKAAGQLLDDLHRNVRLLGTPERSVYIVTTL